MSVIVSLKLAVLCADCVLMRVLSVCVLTVQVCFSRPGAPAGVSEVYKHPGPERRRSDYTHTHSHTHRHKAADMNPEQQMEQRGRSQWSITMFEEEHFQGKCCQFTMECPNILDRDFRKIRSIKVENGPWVTSDPLIYISVRPGANQNTELRTDSMFLSEYIQNNIDLSRLELLEYK